MAELDEMVTIVFGALDELGVGEGDFLPEEGEGVRRLGVYVRTLLLFHAFKLY